MMGLSRHDLKYVSESERVPLGAHITIGYKGPTGAPVEKDRFYIGVPYADGRGKDARRAPHPAFAPFNAAGMVPKDASPEQQAKAEADRAKCRVIRGILVHAQQDDCYSRVLRAYRLPSRNGAPAVSNPSGAPACEGDGSKALRYAASAGGSIEMHCGYRQCPYFIAKDCRTHTRLLFQLRWPSGSPLPTPLTMFSSLGWETGDNIAAMFDWVRNQAKLLGVANVDFFGFPFMLSLYSKTNPEAKSRFPVVSATADFPDGMTLQEWLYQKSSARRELSERASYVALPMLSSDEVLAGDLSTLSHSRGES